jgi:hypothetical protein
LIVRVIGAIGFRDACYENVDATKRLTNPVSASLHMEPMPLVTTNLWYP